MRRGRAGGRIGGVSEPQEQQQTDDESNNLHPGQHDEGGHGGMATREHDARRDADED